MVNTRSSCCRDFENLAELKVTDSDVACSLGSDSPNSAQRMRQKTTRRCRREDRANAIREDAMYKRRPTTSADRGEGGYATMEEEGNGGETETGRKNRMEKEVVCLDSELIIFPSGAKPWP